MKFTERRVDIGQLAGGNTLKTLEDLLGDRDAIAAVQTLLAHGFGPDVIAEAAHRFIAHGVRRGAALVERMNAAERGER